jgi:hypothetical protein
MLTSAQEVIDRLGLEPHPEGGHYRQTYRHADALDVRGGRPTATAIFFLLRRDEVSAWHRVASDELWFFHAGQPLRLRQISPEGELMESTLSMDLWGGGNPQVLVPAGHWQAAVPEPGPWDWSLVSCVVAPGFDFADFALATEAEMAARFPALAERLALRA